VPIDGEDLMLSSGLNFINILRTAFTPVVPQSVRTQSSRQYLFTLLGPTCIKAVRRTLVKLTPDVAAFDFHVMTEEEFGTSGYILE